MCICLITAPTVTEFSDSAELGSEAVQHSGKEPQLGVLSLAASLEERGESVQLLDLNQTYTDYTSRVTTYISQDFVETTARALAANGCVIYGFSTICSSYPLTLRIAKAVKANRPRSTILLGGPQASVVDVQTLVTFPHVDFVLRGEAEQTLPLFADQLRGRQRFDQVPGLTYRSAAQPRRNCNAPLIRDLDALPFPAYHMTQYLDGAERASLELGRGCPFSCTFCSTNDFFRRKFRLRSPQRVLRDMRRIASTYSIRRFELVHDMFTVDRRRVEAFCQAMIDSGENFTWSCSARTDCIDEELLELMAGAGCRGIFYGVEVGSQKMQAVIDKHLDIQHARKIIHATERLGIASTVSLISGFPEETWDDVRQSVSVFMHSATCAKSHPQLNLLAPLAETPLLTNHRNELILEELCSCVSHQARAQERADVEMIVAYPDIFPNFYVIPTPHLERERLFELREFALMGLARFRWLLVAIDQNTSGILDFFMGWREYRVHHHPTLDGSALRQYYRGGEFRQEFPTFVRAQLSKRAAVKAVLDYEYTLQHKLHDARTLPNGELVPPEVALSPEDVPVTKDRIVVFELGYDIQRVVDALKLQKKYVRSRGRHFYVTRPLSLSNAQVEEISDWMAHLLQLCHGRRSVKEIVPLLSVHLPEVESSLRAYVCMRLLQGARQQQLIEVYRLRAGSQEPPIGASD